MIAITIDEKNVIFFQFYLELSFFCCIFVLRNKNHKDMNDRELFNAVFDNFAAKHHGLRMSGTLVYYRGECIFNTDGYNLEYNLLRLTKLLDEEGELR